MAYVNINALCNVSLRLKITYFVSVKFSFYKWCVTKVAHCRFASFCDRRMSVVPLKHFPDFFYTQELPLYEPTNLFNGCSNGPSPLDN